MSLRVLKKREKRRHFYSNRHHFFFLGNRRTADNLATNAHDPGYGACDVDLKLEVCQVWRSIVSTNGFEFLVQMRAHDVKGPY